MISRWERLLETKPISLREQLIEEVSKLLARDLARWPLPVQGVDEIAGDAFAPLFRADAPRPQAITLSEAFGIARWELSRETDAIDDYFRNRRYLERGIPEPERLALQLLARWLLEQLLALAEATENRIKRHELLDCLERTQRRWRISSPHE